MDLFQLMLWKPWFCIYSMFSITPLRDHLRWVGSLSIPFQVVLVLIFHLRTFALRLQVLYRFLEFFSKFDWDNLCVGLWGPVPIRSLPDMKGTMVFLLSYLIYFLIEWRNDFFAVIGSEFFFPFKYWQLILLGRMVESCYSANYFLMLVPLYTLLFLLVKKTMSYLSCPNISTS